MWKSESHVAAEQGLSDVRWICDSCRQAADDTARTRALLDSQEFDPRKKIKWRRILISASLVSS
jgi:hypothetical protein